MRGCVRYVMWRHWRCKRRLCRVDVCMCGNCDRNMGFMFVACINGRNVNVSSSLQIWWRYDFFFPLPSVCVSLVEPKLQWTLKSHDSCMTWFMCSVYFLCTLSLFCFSTFDEVFYFYFLHCHNRWNTGGCRCTLWKRRHGTCCLKSLLITSQTSLAWMRIKRKSCQ